MPKKRKIEIELTAKEEAFVHYEMEFGRNESIKRQDRSYIMQIRVQTQ
mgnify:FL=1